MYSLDDYDYQLPEHMIAQKPLPRRDRSRLLFLERRTGGLSHHIFSEINTLLAPSDVLVVNDTRVIPGRLVGRKSTGGRAEVLLLNYGAEEHAGARERVCQCLIKTAKRAQAGTRIVFEQGLEADVVEDLNGTYRVRFTFDGDFDSLLYRLGRVPLPPYIRRAADKENALDRDAYQTVYARHKGAVAAPTAGLHFSENLLGRLKARGVEVVAITLHVSYGTFVPVRVADIREHRMHAEHYWISETAARMVNQAKAEGKRIVAVGTTSMRTLEFAADDQGQVTAGRGSCDLFIYPGYCFKVVDALITNFHLPKSTLLMLVAAFAGHENIFKAYQTAIANDYRFYSYGDAMLIA